MIPKGLFTQIGMVIVSVAIVITYIKPSFSEIAIVQDNIAVYQEKRSKVASVNAQLKSLVSKLESVSNDDKKRLLSYMPDEIDPISVTRDLFLITETAGAFYVGTQFVGLIESERKSRSKPVAGDVNTPIAYSFQLSVESTYEQLKSLLGLMEQSHYPLELRNMDIKKLFGGVLSVNMTLVTYTYKNDAIGGDNIEF